MLNFRLIIILAVSSITTMEDFLKEHATIYVPILSVLIRNSAGDNSHALGLEINLMQKLFSAHI
jgi:hypothetical protein